MRKKSEAQPVVKKSLAELQLEHTILEAQLEEYLLVLGVDANLVAAVIADLKEQMYTHADENINSMVADLINLESSIMIAKEEEKANEESKMPQPV